MDVDPGLMDDITKNLYKEDRITIQEILTFDNLNKVIDEKFRKTIESERKKIKNGISLVPIHFKMDGESVKKWGLLVFVNKEGDANKLYFFSYQVTTLPDSYRFDAVCMPGKGDNLSNANNTGIFIVEVMTRICRNAEIKPEEISNQYSKIDQSVLEFTRKDVIYDIIARYPNSTYVKSYKEFTKNPYLESKNNQIKFLMDGEEFFGEIEEQINIISRISSKLSSDTYVRIAVFWAELECRLNLSTLEVMLKKIADKGCKVDVILWCANSFILDTQVSPHNIRFQRSLNGYNKGRISVFREKYNKFLTHSNHQKIAIFSCKGKLSVITGGLNFKCDYMDTVEHDHGIDEEEFGQMHDTGVLVEGPATIDIETEWLRRWRKKSKKPVIRGRYKDQQIAASTESVNIRVATTNFEGKHCVKDIKSLLIKSIEEAKNDIYIEGYTFVETDLIKALVAKLKQEVPPRIKIMLPARPFINKNSYPNKYESLLLRRAMLILSFFSCTGVKVDKTEYLKKDYTGWDIEYSRGHKDPWLEEDWVVLSKGNKSDKFLLNDITSFTGTKTIMHQPFFRPVKRPDYMKRYEKGIKMYIHSKVCIIDHSILMVGSSNFNYRSFNYDGELSCFISGNKKVVKGVFDRLENHFNDSSDNGAVYTEAVKINVLMKRPTVFIKEPGTGGIKLKYMELAGDYKII